MAYRGLARLLPLTLVLSFAGGLLSAPAANAYGNKAVWQIGLSMNCNNRSVCGNNLGGFWGWAEFDSDNTADAQLTGCSHVSSQFAGAQHISSDVQGWFVAPGQAGPRDFWIRSEDVTLTGRGLAGPLTLHDPNPPYPSDTGIPAVAGHYSTDEVLGFTAPPGISIQVQVTKIPNR